MKKLSSLNKNGGVMTGIRLMLFALLLFITACEKAEGQIQPFQKKFGGIDSELIWRIAAGENESYYSIGHVQEDGQTDTREVVVSHFNNNAEITSSWILGNENYYDTGSGIIVLSNGDIIVLSNRRPYNSTIDNALISRITSDGVIDWSIQFGDELTEVLIQQLYLTSENKILASGRLLNTAAGSNEKGVLIKMDTNGSVLFRKEWNQSSDFDEFNSVTETNDGYLVTGYSDYADPDAPVVPIIAKFSVVGDLIWSNAYSDGSQYPVNNHLIVHNNDGTFVTACNIGTDSSNSAEDRDILVMKINFNGSVIWARRLNGPDMDDVDNMILSHPNEWNGSKDIILNGDLVGLGFAELNGLVLRVSQDGELINANAYGKDGTDSVTDLIPIEDEGCQGYIMVGTTSSFNIEDVGDAWILKVDANLGDFGDCFTQNIPFTVSPVNMQISSVGTVGNWNVSSTPEFTISPVSLNSIDISCDEIAGDECIVSVEEIQNDKITSTVYPNPNTGQFMVELDSKLRVSDTHLFDLIGNEIPFEFEINEKNLSITVPKRYKGMFFLELVTVNGVISTKVSIK